MLLYRILFLILAFILVFTLVVSFWSPDRGMYDLGLEANLGTSLPEGGEILYKIFAPMGKDAMEYAVIQYPEGSSIIDHFQWKPIDGYAWGPINRLIESIGKYISRNEEETPIPSEYIPSRDMLYTMIGNYPSIADPYAFIVFSPTDMRVYVLIHLT